MAAPVPFTLDTTALASRATNSASEVSYNGFNFPPAIKSSLSYKPIYDDANRGVKYVELTLKIDCYVFYGVTGALGTAIAYVGATHVQDTTKTTDTTLDTIRMRLSQPGQQLKFNYQGAGSITIQPTSNTGGQTTFTDMKNGPITKVIDWRPLTNKMAFISWECTSCITPCTTGTFSTDLLALTYDISFNINTSGCTVRTIKGSLEVPAIRIPNPTVPYAGTVSKFDVLQMEKTVTELFPLLPQFLRTQNYSLSSDRTTFNFTITDTEIDSDEAYGIGCSKEECVLSAAGSLTSGGFRKWLTTMSGSITVAAGFPKSYAFAEISRLFNKFYSTNSTTGWNGPGYEPAAVISQNTTPGSNTNKSYPILQSVEYSDNIFGRTISFKISWTLFVAPHDLFKATGLFKPVRNSLSDQDKAWSDWATSLGVTLEHGGYQGLGLTNYDEVIVSMCRPAIKPPLKYPNVPKDQKDNVPSSSTAPIADSLIHDENNSYAVYDARFYIERNNNTLTHKPLDDTKPVNPDIDGNAGKDNNGVDFGKGDKASVNSTKAVNHKPKESTYVIVFTGYAVRLEHAIDIPELKSYGGHPATKIGIDDIRPIKLGTGVDIKTGKTYAINALIWRQRYSLPAKPSNDIIASDGMPEKNAGPGLPGIYNIGPGTGL